MECQFFGAECIFSMVNKKSRGKPDNQRYKGKTRIEPQNHQQGAEKFGKGHKGHTDATPQPQGVWVPRVRPGQQAFQGRPTMSQQKHKPKPYPEQAQAFPPVISVQKTHLIVIKALCPYPI